MNAEDPPRDGEDLTIDVAGAIVGVCAASGRRRTLDSKSLTDLAAAAGVAGTVITWSLGPEGEWIVGSGGGVAAVGDAWPAMTDRVVVVWDRGGPSLNRQGAAADLDRDVASFDDGRGIVRRERADRTRSWAASTAHASDRIAACTGASVTIHQIRDDHHVGIESRRIDLGRDVASVAVAGDRVVAATGEGQLIEVEGRPGRAIVQGDSPLLWIEEVDGVHHAVFASGTALPVDRPTSTSHGTGRCAG